MKGIKLIFIFIILIIIVLIFIKFYFKNKENQNREGEGLQETDVFITDLTDIENVTEKNTVIWCLETYLSIVNENNNIKTLLDILDDEYIKENNITLENVKEKLERYESTEVEITQAKMKNIDSFITNYYVIGTIKDNQIKILIKLDYEKNTFSIIPANNYTVEEFLNITSTASIPNNENNKYKYQEK